MLGLSKFFLVKFIKINNKLVEQFKKGSEIECNHTIISRSLSSSNSFPSKYHQVGHKYIFPDYLYRLNIVFSLFALVVFISFIEIKPKYPLHNFEHTTSQSI